MPPGKWEQGKGCLGLGTASSPLTWPWATPSLPCSPSLRGRSWPRAPEVPTESPLLRKSHPWTSCQDCGLPLLLGSQPGGWRLHGRPRLLLGVGVLTGAPAHPPPQWSAVQALCPAQVSHQHPTHSCHGSDHSASPHCTQEESEAQRGEANGSIHRAAQQRSWKASPPKPPLAQPETP